MSNLPIKEVRHEEEHPVCEKCGAEMTEIGEEKAYDELVYVPGEFYVRRHIVKKYKCTKCGQDPEDAEKYLTELFSQPAGTILLPWREKNDETET